MVGARESDTRTLKISKQDIPPPFQAKVKTCCIPSSQMEVLSKISPQNNGDCLKPEHNFAMVWLVKEWVKVEVLRRDVTFEGICLVRQLDGDGHLLEDNF